MRNVPETIHAYKIPRLNWIFVFFSLLFVASMIWMIWFDYIGYRKWKDFQREFQSIEAAKLQRDIQDAKEKAAAAGVKDMEKAIEDQNARISANADKKKTLETEVNKRRVEFETRDTVYKFRKADLDAQKYKHDVAFEELEAHPNDESAKAHYGKEKAELESLAGEVANLELQVQQLEKSYKDSQAELNQIVGEKTQLEKELKRLQSNRVLAEKRLDKLTNTVIQSVVNAPFLEIAEPTIRVKQIMLEDHRVNVNFADAPRVDRCISCHNGIAKSDPKDGSAESGKIPSPQEIQSGNFRFADLPQPHRAHPKLDLFVGESSPHPMDRFGCTPCHWGWDRGMDFSRAAHTPDEEKLVQVSLNGSNGPRPAEMPQDKAWTEKYGWHEMHHAEQKMRPASFIESSCLKCHVGETTIPHAEKLEHGIRLIEQAGCYNCHKMGQLETYVTHQTTEGEDIYAVARLFNSDARLIRNANALKTDELKPGTELSVPIRALTKTGPNLHGISSKLDRDFVRNWLADPKRFRPNTFMPQFWNLEPTYVRLSVTPVIQYKGVSGGQEIGMAQRDAVEIDAITELLFAVSDAPKYPSPPVAGEAARGKSLVESLGCFACHVINERLEKDSHYSDGTKVDEQKFPLLTLGETKVSTLSENQYKRSRSQGPMLFGSGSKMDMNWLYAWLKDPKQYHPYTKMPNLRLSDQEAADIASFLVTLHNEDFEKRQLAEKNRRQQNQSEYQHVRDDLVQEYLEGEYPKFDAQMLVKNYQSDARRKSEFDGKISDLLIRTKYSDLNELHSHWASRLAWMSRLSAEATESERLAGKTDLERLAKEMRDTSQLRPDAATLLTNWANQVSALVPTVANWNKIEDRKSTIAQAQAAADQGRHALGEFAAKQADGFDLETKKKLYVGEKLVGRYGCYSCHNIAGFENAKPIGTELSEWGTKQTSTLDFGYLEDKIEHNNYAYVQQKVKAPRSFDKPDVKKPQEWLKMPQFNFSEEQVKAIAVVIMGMTDEKVLPQARKKLSEAEFQVESGRWLVKELNCVGCHMVERKGGAILATLDASQKQMWPPNLQGLGTKVKPTWLYHFLQDPGAHKYRYWLNVRMPTFGFSDEQINTITRYFALLDKQNYPFEEGVLQATYNPPKETVEIGEQIYEKFQCLKCHQVRPPEMAARASNIGPNMQVVKERLRPNGLVTWLRDPSAVTPGVNMPANWPTEPEAPNPFPGVLGGDTLKQIHAVADYLLTYDGEIEKRHPLPKEETKPAGGKSEYE